ncbi:membrane-spanning 4-domains subfamily A member 8-like [Dendropsophus ebraccatus]|uniref:membrane-spanning 4-domains subfamily A member 8-like n=1 Tax=Dendropsophus ebraccatus TaxID=150705 RepID=UPI00383135D9
MDSHTSIPMSHNGDHLPVMTGAFLPMDFYHRFLKGKPLAIGVVIIVVSLIHMALGIQSFFNVHLGPYSIFTGILFWAPMSYIIAGSLMIAGKRKPSICLVNGSMILNIINSFMSVAGLILAVFDIYIVTMRCYQRFRSDSICIGFGGMATYSILLVSDILLLVIFIYSAVLGGRSMNLVPSIPQTSIHWDSAKQPETLLAISVQKFRK